jgi:hypothetical protein
MVPFICKYCGKDTSEVEYDYLSDHDHLSCALYAKFQTDEYDSCILCGVETEYKRSTHIDMRVGYIEGAGQLCRKCYNKGTERRHLTIPANLIYDTPNDAELGAAVRKLYNENNN